MFENIPNIWVFVGVALSVVGFLAIVMCVSKFVENEKENAIARKNAKLNDETFDEVNERLSRKFWFGYLIVAVLGACVAVVLGLIALDFALAFMDEPIESGRLMFLYVALSAIIWVIGDRYLFTRLGDSAYFARVESSAIKAFLGDTDTPIKAEPVNVPDTETPKNDDDLFARIAGMTNEEKVKLIDAILK